MCLVRRRDVTADPLEREKFARNNPCFAKTQTVDYGNLTVEQLTHEQLLAIAAGGSPDTVMKALPPPRK